MALSLSLAREDLARRRTAELIDIIFPPPRIFGVRLWDGSKLSSPNRPLFRIMLNHPAALRRKFMPPVELSIGEAYIYGDYDIEGDFFSAVGLADGLAGCSFSLRLDIELAEKLLALPKAGPDRILQRGPAHLSGARHSRQRERAAIQYHYDVGNDFYS